MKKEEVVLAIPDLHCPFEHKHAFEFIKAVKRKYKPTQIVFLGDEVDNHAISYHEKDPDGFSPGHELDHAVEHMKKYYKLFPEAMVCTSNHTSLPYRKAKTFGLPARFLKEYRSWLEAPAGWEWSDVWEIDGILYEHGESFGGILGAINHAKANMQSTVIGHIHSFAGILFGANKKMLFWGLNSGCLIDKDKYAFHYGKKFKGKPILGASIIDRGIPTFIPMKLNKNGEWTGEL